jgi:hypothetical protein
MQARPRERPTVRMFLPEPVDHCLLMNAYRYVEDQNRLARHRGAVDRLQLHSQSDSLSLSCREGYSPNPPPIHRDAARPCLRAIVILFARESGGLSREQLQGFGAGFFFFATEMEMPFPNRRRDELNGDAQGTNDTNDYANGDAESEGGRNSLEGPHGDMFHENQIGFHLL